RASIAGSSSSGSKGGAVKKSMSGRGSLIIDDKSITPLTPKETPTDVVGGWLTK
ncbi:hypothetical protein HDU76_011491, partial [Blyttiomyces sp. JEL0837]